MCKPLIIRDRIITDSDIEFVRSLVEKHKDKNRFYLSKLLAKEWQWYQRNGLLKDRACRDILTILERSGFIKLPPSRRRQQHKKRNGNSLQQSLELYELPIEGELREFSPLSFKMVCQSPLELQWNQLVNHYHYLGYTNIVGSYLKYLVYTSDDRLVAALGWGSAVWKLKPRDKAIGWTPTQRKENLHKIANNHRFLILPWVKIRNLASHTLSQNIHMINEHWEQRYGYKLSLLETFIDCSRFKGTSYRAANWIYIGRTKGFRKQGNSFQYHGNPKEVFLYPLSRHFRKELGVDSDFLPSLHHHYSLSLCETEKPKRERNMILQHEGWNRQLPPPIDLQEEDIEILSDEFEQFHRLFDKAFYRIEQTILSRRYVQGLMSPLERKSMEPIALSLMDTHRVSALQKFVSCGKWETETLATLHKEETAKTIADPQGVLSVDGSDFPKKGKESVGVARQYCGHLGKVDNCQAGVFLAYSSPKGYALLDRRLFLPELWFSKEYEERWQKCKIPEETPFKTKNQLASEMIQQLQKDKMFPAQWIACDESFGRDSKFLDNLPKECYYFAEVPNNTHVWTQRPVTKIPAYSGRGRKPKGLQCSTKSTPVLQLSKNAHLEWQKVNLAEGTKGPIIAEVTRLRVIESRTGLPGQEIWLFIRRSLDKKETKYFLSNAALETSLEEMCLVCTMRWPIEQCFQEGKSELGMDHYEHRSWEAWHRHMTFVFLAQLFLLKIRLKFKKNSGINVVSSNDTH